jgi:hypothetical protein
MVKQYLLLQLFAVSIGGREEEGSKNHSFVDDATVLGSS